jgi:hypothetical protein
MLIAHKLWIIIFFPMMLAAQLGLALAIIEYRNPNPARLCGNRAGAATALESSAAVSLLPIVVSIFADSVLVVEFAFATGLLVWIVRIWPLPNRYRYSMVFLLPGLTLVEAFSELSLVELFLVNVFGFLYFVLISWNFGMDKENTN